ncbi:hypothetical protein GV827_15260 [Sulfitobacter sp. JBTF-M27]|uniref:Uncharacterized protein n=1 Tax=Sulfitobacter sediminilitoris TaxID=2698830 RepID=A0A6P0CF90_9RHOB|nr:acetoacetate decarboxylase family protein [Sulfitobacter sediminilitoris]NEK23756.1 hypothetical protein [Sulfitobacter sediminilitoris]
MSTIPFNIARGAASSLQMSPPFAFNDVTMSVFPLRASLPTLEAFCRNYLNHAPNLVQFSPFVPFVYLVILDYGRMSLEAANMGWVSQREVAFGIPLRWLNAQDGGLQFHDWAFTSPFIFVDNEMSMSTGREVYGWPKLLSRLDPSVSEWVRDPHGSRRVFQVSTQQANEAFVGETQEYRSFVSVYQHRTAGLLDVPPNLDALIKPLSQMSQSLTGLSRLSVDLARTFTGMASDGITGSSVMPNLLDMKTFKEQLDPERLRNWRDPKSWIPGLKDVLWSLFPRAYANTINFKQFRDARDPFATCYQAVTSAKMPVTNVKAGGFLGPQNMLLGQLDGGFRIDVHHLAGLPIVQSLGLEVSEEREIGGARVSSLAPVSPFWLQVDMTYGLADTLIWRSRSGAWHETKELSDIRKEAQNKAAAATPAAVAEPETPAQEIPPSPEEVPAPKSIHSAIGDRKPIGDADLEDNMRLDYIQAINFFNTARGGSEAIGGAFYMPDASVRVLPLKADPAALQAFVSNYLHVQGHMRFKAWGDFVYLVICDFDQVNSEVNAIAKRRAREVNMMVPVKAYDWYADDAFPEKHRDETKFEDANMRALRGEKHLVTTGFVSAFSYVDDAATAITASEVSGIPSMGSRILSPSNDWVSADPSKKEAHHDLLTTSAQVLPALMAGAEAQERDLIRLHTHAPKQRDVPETQRESVGRWIRLLADDLEEKSRQSVIAGTDRPEAYSDNEPDDPFEDNGKPTALGDLLGDDPLPFNVGQGFALQILGGELPLNQFALKQFRDSRHTTAACYQGLVTRQHRINKLRDMREIQMPIHISITDYPTQPICKVLGLIPKFTYPGKDRLVNVFEAIRPLSLHADVHRGSGSTLYERVGSPEWKKVDTFGEIFGWRYARQGEAEQLVEQAATGLLQDDIELCYCLKDDGMSPPIMVQSGLVGAEYVSGEFARQLKTSDISNLMIKGRFMGDEVGMVTDPLLLFSQTSDAMLDISAWISEMRLARKETRMSQARAAGKIEWISPATVLDSVLSQQWGHAPGSERHKYCKPDFCVPRSTVPTPFAKLLFPSSELQHGFWPHSIQRSRYQEQRRHTEMLGLKSELWHTLRSLAQSSMRTKSASSWTVEDYDVHAFVDTQIERMRNALTEAERAAVSAFTRQEAGLDEEALGDIARFIEALAKALLPEPFREENTREEFAKLSDYSFERQAACSFDLWDLREALKRLQSILTQEGILDHRAAENFNWAFFDLIERTSRNFEKVSEFEVAQSDFSSRNELMNPQGLMRARLAKIMTGGVLPDEDFI